MLLPPCNGNVDVSECFPLCAPWQPQEWCTVCSFRIDAAVTGMPEFVSEVSMGDTKPCNIAPLP